VSAVTTGSETYAVVIPSLGRPSLSRLLETLADQDLSSGGAVPLEVVVVDDRRGTDLPPLDLPAHAGGPVRAVRGYGRGPAAARNRGWRSARRSGATWIAFLDDDVELPRDWAGRLTRDLASCAPGTGGSQGRIEVPRPSDRRPTDWERNTASLEQAAWATADMAYRPAALEAVDGFDERFPRAYREDADLALRVRHAGWQLVRGERRVLHPARPADALVSLRVQAGNADDALMRRLHGPRWREQAEAPRGALRAHLVTTAALAAVASGTVLATAVGRRSTVRAGRGLLGAGLAVWGVQYTRFLARRMLPGPRPGDDRFASELARMGVTSAAIPVAAVRHRLRGTIRHRRTVPWPPPVRAVLFDRDGTLVHDVPYNGDPERVRPVEGAREALAALRDAGLALGVVSNQSGIGRGRLTTAQVDAVDHRIRELLGPFGTWQRCPHAPDAGCTCRKPRPGMVTAAAAALGVRPQECVVIGDIGADVEAAHAAGARSVLVPTPQTLPAEVTSAPEVAATLGEAVALVLPGRDAAGGRR